MISVSAAIQTALASDNPEFAWLIELPDGIYMTDHGSDIAWDNKTWVSAGDVLSIPPIVREKDIKLHSATIKMSGVDGVLYAALSARNMTNETCRFLLVILDDDGLIIDQPIGMYQGTFDGWSDNDTGTTETINIKLTNHWAKPSRTSGRVTSPNNQEDHHSGDKFFEHAHEEKSNLGWGKEA